MTIYTRTGDQGETDLFDGRRAAKDVALLEVCGTLDELNSLLGLARCESLPQGVDAMVEQIQRRLFDVGAGLAKSSTTIGPGDATDLERAIDRYESRMEPAAAFLVPAGCRAAAVLHLARAVCRRAERRLVTLAKSEPQSVSRELVPYLNRLSDLLFILARTANAEAGITDARC